MKNKLIDILALIVGGVVLAMFCLGVGLIVYFKVIERPTEFTGVRAESDVLGGDFGRVKGKTNLRRRVLRYGESIFKYAEDAPDFLDAPAIDIQPDGGGLEGEMGQEELDKAIGMATSAAYSREGKQGQHAK